MPGPDDDGDIPPPGPGGVGPAELGFAAWTQAALATAKAKFPDATIIDATATKSDPPPATKYSLNISGRFRVQSAKQVVVTGSQTAGFKVSAPDDILLGSSDVKDLTKVKVDPWNIWASNKPLASYVTFRLFKPLPNPTAKTPLPDQAYYAFTDSKNTRIGLFGASDGKSYPVS